MLATTRENMRHLRRFGIRNASDLLQAYEAAVARGERNAAAAGVRDRAAIAELVRQEVDQLRSALTTPGTRPDPSGDLPIQGVLDTLPDEEWFTQIRNWGWSEFGACDSWCWYIDGHWPFPQRPKQLPVRVRRSLARPPMFSMRPPPATLGG